LLPDPIGNTAASPRFPVIAVVHSFMVHGADGRSRDEVTIVAAVEALAVHTCTIDGELIACDANGLADFQLLRWLKRDDPAILCAFDLLQIDGRDLQDEPIETRKAELARAPERMPAASSPRLGITPARSSSSTRASSAARVS
jgi:ATP-dependent DNA ligase